MSEFVAITTQEEFDARIGERLKRERETVARKYEGFISKEDHDSALGALQKKLEAASKASEESGETIKALQEKVKGYETDSVKTRIALEEGLPLDMASRLSGADEEAIRKDAQFFAGFMKGGQGGAPAASTEPLEPADSKTAAYQSLLSTIKQEG